MLQIRQINTTGNLLILGFSGDKINTLIVLSLLLSISNVTAISFCVFFVEVAAVPAD